MRARTERTTRLNVIEKIIPHEMGKTLESIRNVVLDDLASAPPTRECLLLLRLALALVVSSNH